MSFVQGLLELTKLEVNLEAPFKDIEVVHVEVRVINGELLVEV